jgi:iron complex transport system substrate-binding protein
MTVDGSRWRHSIAGPVLLLIGLVGCGDVAPPLQDEQLRIVSLSPAISQVLGELDLAHAIVATGDGDTIAPPGTPSLGRFVDPDTERLISLAPTHVLATPGVNGLPPRMSDLESSGRFVLAEFEYPDTVADAVAIIPAIGRSLDRAERAERLAAAVHFQLEGIGRLTAERGKPSALLLFGLRPVMVSGPGTVHDELLTLAGGVNAAASLNASAPTLDREALLRLSPDVIFLLLPGEPPLRGPKDPRLAGLREVDVPAVRDGRVILLNDPAVLLPGPSMSITAASMAVALHPDLAGAVAEVFRASP